ncbi:MAG: hypothetical protein ACLUIS_05915 [Longibaculum sp.]
MNLVLDDKKLITFNNNNKTCIIDLTTLKSTNLNVECIYHQHQLLHWSLMKTKQ